MQPSRVHPSWLLALALICALGGGCQKADRAHETPPPPAAAAAPAAPTAAVAGPSGALAHDGSDSSRRIIRTAELSIETEAFEAAASKVPALADARGGFVVSSDTARSLEADGSEVVTTTVVFRVPAAAFDDAIVAVRALGTRVSSEKVTGQDVTEEYVDLEARIRAQRAVEEQYVVILREAKTIPDILAVQQKLGEVRTEIDRAEGRRRLLENETTLSTITVHVAPHIASVEASGPGFGRSVREAVHDALVVGIAIVNGAIRLVGVLLPVGVLVVAPVWLLVRSWRRRRRTGAHSEVSAQ
ncbi:MAG TPA: DUF4349 domain-containing protein [Polyangiaceae bacterium]